MHMLKLIIRIKVPNIKITTPNKWFICRLQDEFFHSFIPFSSSLKCVFFVFPTVVWYICIHYPE
ncbi:hypothetical protein HanIR_Chr09g0443341 [Helianthus annuus]|nr:hypothetical protein HanIR_Chr09g0443341 [Helianthus annuus]